MMFPGETARNTTDLIAGRVLSTNAKGGTVATRYAQKKSHVGKKEARAQVLSEFDRDGFPHYPLRILTFPFTNWYWEGFLLNNRHGSKGWHFGQKVGAHTQIIGIEREEAIYKIGCRLIPGKAQGLRYKDVPSYAKASLRSFAVRRYLLCSFEALASGGSPILSERFIFNGAWLDFNGPINIARGAAIRTFLENHCGQQMRLVVTALNGHYDAESAEQWGEHKPEAITEWLSKLRPGGVVRRLLKYNDGAPMFQVSFDFKRKE